MELIHAFDDPMTIAGQGTIGKEILDAEWIILDAVFVPVGGGGLLAGVSAWIAQQKKKVKIYEWRSMTQLEPIMKLLKLTRESSLER